MEPSASTDSPLVGRIDALFARIHLLEQHALAVMAAFHADAMKADARDVISTLEHAETWLAAVPDAVADIETLVDAVSQQLSGLGSTKPAVPLAGAAPVPTIPSGSLLRSLCGGGPARRVGDRLPAHASLPRRLGERRGSLRWITDDASTASAACRPPGR
jgi:hypothetical protein